ncbi:MAG: acetyl-CoA carboxylase biotin carboxyl carrier protein [bacterium]
MKEDEIRRLIKIVEESDIGELQISRWGKKIKISKFSQNSQVVTNSPPSHAYPVSTNQPQTSIQSTGLTKTEIPVAAEPVAEHKNTVEIKAPMVGTLYRAPAPDADPYVDVDQIIKKGQVLCIIEAMKLMNEIESEYDGRIVEILIENGQPVEYNQPLFRIETM